MHRSARVICLLLAVAACAALLIYAFSPGFGLEPPAPAADAGRSAYHFALITPETDSFYWQSFQNGARQFAGRNAVALETYGPRFINFKEQERYLEFVILAGVDGIITSIPEEPRFLALIEEARERNIPVVTPDSIVEPYASDVTFIGIEPFHLGRKAGEALIQACRRPARIAVLVDPSRSRSTNDRFIAGLAAALRGSQALQVGLVLGSNNGTISAEEQTYNILMNHPEINAIYCANGEDTIGAARVIVDLNRVNAMTVIGSGLTSEIARYIERGVVYGTVSINPYRLGALSVAALLAIKSGKPIPSLTSADLAFITAQNLRRFTREYHLDRVSDDA